jgi:prolyl 4-hydroxylase
LYDRCVVDQGFDQVQVLETIGRHDGRPIRKEQPEEAKNKSNDDDDTGGKRIPVKNVWKEWIRMRLDQGNTKEEVFLMCMDEGLDLDQVSQSLGGYRARAYEDPSHIHNKPAFTKRTFLPRAWRLDTDLVELYEIPNFLTPEECRDVTRAIRTGILERSSVTDGNETARTSRTCHLRQKDDTRSGIIGRVEAKLQSLMGERCNPITHSETLQGQCYGVGEYFQAHTDWFEPNSEEYETHGRRGGQRTWTVMIYLNDVEEGGATKFVHLDRDFRPRQGWALAWNNLDADNKTPNPWTLHEAMPVVQGTKYVLTKWYRECSMHDSAVVLPPSGKQVPDQAS